MDQSLLHSMSWSQVHPSFVFSPLPFLTPFIILLVHIVTTPSFTTRSHLVHSPNTQSFMLVLRALHNHAFSSINSILPLPELSPRLMFTVHPSHLSTWLSFESVTLDTGLHE